MIDYSIRIDCRCRLVDRTARYLQVRLAQGSFGDQSAGRAGRPGNGLPPSILGVGKAFDFLERQVFAAVHGVMDFHDYSPFVDQNVGRHQRHAAFD